MARRPWAPRRGPAHRRDRHRDARGHEAPDLIDLDLAYAPPYGQAKDPVNQTGMVAHNVLTGELILTGPDALTEDMPVLDVRTSGGVRGWAHCPTP